MTFDWTPRSERRSVSSASSTLQGRVALGPDAGRFTEESSLLGGRTGVEVERLNLGESSETSWLLAFLRLADPWFHIWRNSLGLQWGLGPGAGAGDDSDPSHLRGAAEIVFLPLVRIEKLT